MSPLAFNVVHWRTVLWSVALVAGAALLAVVLKRIMFAVANRVSKHSPNSALGALTRYGENPAQLILLLTVTLAFLPWLPLPPAVNRGAQHAVVLGLIAGIGWMLIAVVEVFDDLVAIRHSGDIRH